MTLSRSALLTALTGAVLFLAGCGHDHPNKVPRQANAPCADLAGAGFPLLDPPIKRPFFVCHKGLMALEFNPTTKTALWVVEHLTRAQVTGTFPIIADFRVDPNLGSEVRNTPTDFALKDFLPGQLAAVGDFRFDDVKMSRTFYLSNAVPMPAENRNGIWRRLEKNVQGWAAEKGELYVISGPIFYGGQPLQWIGGPPPQEGYLTPQYATNTPAKLKHKDKLGVPTHVYKVIYDPAKHSAVAFIIPNGQAIPADQLPRFAVSVQQVEQLTYLSFLPNLPNRNAILSTVTPSDWIVH